MALTKRRSIWYVDLVHPASGKRFRQSTGTSSRALAKEYHDRLQAELWRQSKLGAKVQHSFDEACLRYLEEKGHLRSIAEVARHIQFWRQHFASRPLEYITRDRVEEMIRTLSGSAANKNRHLSTLRCILRLAEREWDWLDRAPALRFYPEPKGRVRFLDRKGAQRLIAACPEWLAEIVRFSLATGLRRANVLGLQWSRVELVHRVAWVDPEEAKAGRAIGVPLNDDAVACIRRQLGKHHEFVFVKDGRPLQEVASWHWQKACRKAGLKDSAVP